MYLYVCIYLSQVCVYVSCLIVFMSGFDVKSGKSNKMKVPLMK